MGECGVIVDDEGGDGAGDGFEAAHFVGECGIGKEFIDEFDAGVVDEFGLGGDGGGGIGGDLVDAFFDLLAELGLGSHLDIDKANAGFAESGAVVLGEARGGGAIEAELGESDAVFFNHGAEVDGNIFERAQGQVIEGEREVTRVGGGAAGGAAAGAEHVAFRFFESDGRMSSQLSGHGETPIKALTSRESNGKHA